MFVTTDAGWLVPEDVDFNVLPLAIEFAHPRDAHIYFRDHDHSYYIQGLKSYTSTTSVCHCQFSTFDAQGIAESLVAKPAFMAGTGRYSTYQALLADNKDATEEELVEAVMAKWEFDGNAASQLGTLMHRNIELSLNGLDYLDDSVEFSYFKNYERECISGRNWLIYRTEWLVWCDLPVKICGSIDALFIDPDGNYHMRDWKRSKKISYHGFGKMGSPPFAHLQDCNFIAYSLQQNIYSEVLRRYYDIEVASMAMVICYPGNDDFLEIPIQRMETEVDYLFNKFSL